MRLIGPDPTGEREQIHKYLEALAADREQNQKGYGLTNIVRQMDYVETHHIDAITDKYPALVEQALGKKIVRKRKVIIEDVGVLGLDVSVPNIQIVDAKTGEVLKGDFRKIGEAVSYSNSQGWLWKFGRTASVGEEPMNVAAELASIHRSLVAVKSNFMVVKMLPLVREGATRDSLENARRILDAGYILKGGTFTFDSNFAEWRTRAQFEWSVDGSVVEHEFRGFSFGYSGEGPRGLDEFLKMFRWNPSPQKIFSKQFGMEKGTVDLKAFL